MMAMKRLFQLIKHRGIQVLLVLIGYSLLSTTLPSEAHRGLYTISVFIKDLLLWILPLTVALFIANTICSFRKSALLFIAAIVCFEALSNFSSVWYAFAGGHIASDFLPKVTLPTMGSDSFEVLWRLPNYRPIWWSADKGTFLGLILGAVALISQKEKMLLFIERGKGAAQWVLTRIFSRLIPLFVLGFVARMHQTNLLNQIFGHYAMLLIWLVFFLLFYLAILFWISSDGTIKGFLSHVKNLLPAGAIAFTSGCSLSTMPWTIDGASKNMKNPQFAKAIIPATTNIQQIGDCIINTFLCFLIYQQFYGHRPDVFTWLTFSVVFILARYATAAVMGGAIFIMLPIYESYLGFNSEMIAIILAFNVVLDPLVTSSNIMANGALCRVFEKVWMKLTESSFGARFKAD
ncbi:MAG: hypothetical protein COT85_00260 [Chlamydiae bacterium CG10_big_fil_rev_8_21_14_0_10_42_34]|nr:MAG: hypothetical protein COT85_00260 [Chlamydiae bacterium CG10_big_fil_rev_8_21_14_0_10_42_34]